MTIDLPLDTEGFVRSEFERLVISDEALADLCASRSRAYLRTDAGATIAERLIGLVRNATPTALIRIGDGEGNALGVLSSPSHPFQFTAFSNKLASQNGWEIGAAESVAFCQFLRTSFASSEIIGFRCCDTELVSDYGQIVNTIEIGNYDAALGLIYARNFLSAGLASGNYADKVLTSAWIHLRLLPYLDDIMRVAESIIVITGRAELEGEFRRRLGSRLRLFLAVPVQGHLPASPEQSHFRAVFPRILEALRTDLRGTLALVGAGLFGKAYCHVARESGAVAVDLGSGFDVLAGLDTRPIHGYFDFAASRWMTTPAGTLPTWPL